MGYGSQALALKYLGVPFEHWKICEWAVKSIQAYKDIHFTNENFDFSNTANKEQLVNWLYSLGISSNYNEPMTKQQIERLSEQQLRTIWNNIVATHNLVNIQQVKGKDLEIVDTNKWKLRLEKLGYKNYFQDLIATDYGIPQTRNRCFMISILGDYNYTFPKLIPLKLKLKDMLEDNVDEKYYLSDKQLESLESGSYNASKPSVKLEITDKGLCQTLDTMSGGNRQPLIRVKNATKQGYLEASDGDGIDLAMPKSETRRGRVQKDSIQTLTTQNNLGVCIGTYQYAKSDNFMQGKDRLQLGKEVSDTLQTTQKKGIVNSDLKIRKLTPRECFRLMGVKDEDFDKVKKNQSDSSLYHLAGDSIVVNVLMAIFNELLKKEGE